MLDLRGRTVRKTVEAEIGRSLLQIAVANRIDFGFNCTRGTCARCRCYIEEGREFLAEPTEAELDRLEEDEIAEGYRLGCQAVVARDGNIRARNKTYF
ncbi:2Fe-2S iron-sulfur cluster-binding protein [Paenibacillus thermotolerans]|uniref:2Fe-2S iron-sulfur cluster-binding protein n=1 Tax=Paenibacillus thermotolerans TaxID=3027807 RepID=UPI0023674351|nr:MULTISPECIES: 2Fe-2S iron-sulfur cluster-binding protein [unclassified Paenibacillus]